MANTGNSKSIRWIGVTSAATVLTLVAVGAYAANTIAGGSEPAEEQSTVAASPTAASGRLMAPNPEASAEGDWAADPSWTGNATAESEDGEEIESEDGDEANESGEDESEQDSESVSDEGNGSDD